MLLLQYSLSDGGNKNFEILKGKYRTFLGMLNWLSISTHPDLATVNSWLVSTTKSPTHAHLEALQHMDQYNKATSDNSISLHVSSKPNAALKAFIQFALDDPTDSLPRPSAFADSNWDPQDASIPSKLNQQMLKLDETHSVCGHIVFMSHGPLLWKSHKECRNSQSSCEAEVKATDKCTKSVHWL
jgi:hypothetical protein